MTNELPAVETRWRLTRPVDRYPHFIAPEGAEGRVVDVSDGNVSLRLDETLAGAEDWDNEVVWSTRDGDDFYADVEPAQTVEVTS